MRRSGTMGSEHAAAAADGFESALTEFIDFTRHADDSDLDREIPVEQRTLRVMLYHIADGLRLTHEWLRHARSGAPVPGQDINAENAVQAREHANATPEEVLRMVELFAPDALQTVHPRSAVGLTARTGSADGCRLALLW